MISDEALMSLVELGFNQLEAQVYAFLVGESPATGYRVAQAIGKPAANTYKAIQSLERKGAVMVDDGENRTCRAVPSDELLERLHRQYEEHRVRASNALKIAESETADERVYALKSREAILERGRNMLASAQEVVLLAASDAIVAAIAEWIQSARLRGVEIQALVGTPLADVDTYPLIPTLPSEELRIVVDGRENLLAYMEGETVIQAVCTKSVPFSLAMHAGMAAEMTLANLEEKIRDEAGPKRLQRAIAQHRPTASTLGYRHLTGLVSSGTTPS